MSSESQIQRAMRRHLAVLGYRTVAVPNGTALRGTKLDRSIQMANLKRDGLTPGFPDFMVIGKGARIGFVEVKTEDGRQSASQVECERWLTEFGHNFALCRSTYDIDDALAAWGWK